MPSDVAVDIVSRPLRADAVRSGTAPRLPIGVGLSIGAGASIALWTCIALSIRALLG